MKELPLDFFPFQHKAWMFSLFLCLCLAAWYVIWSWTKDNVRGGLLKYLFSSCRRVRVTLGKSRLSNYNFLGYFKCVFMRRVNRMRAHQIAMSKTKGKRQIERKTGEHTHTHHMRGNKGPKQWENGHAVMGHACTSVSVKCMAICPRIGQVPCNARWENEIPIYTMLIHMSFNENKAHNRYLCCCCCLIW